MNSSQVLELNARKYPDTEAVISQGNRMTYGELNRLVNKFGNALKEEGIQVGDKVILFMPNVAEFIIAYFAVQRIGSIIVPINAKLTLPEIQYIIDHSDANAFIAHHLLFSTVEGLENIPLTIKTGEAVGTWRSFESLIDKGNDTVISCHLKEQDQSTILYTSGTTGRPKGVLFSYRNILSVANMICVEFEMKPESRILLMMPLSHSAPLHLFLMSGILVGATLVLTPAFTPELLLNTVEQERTTHFFGAPIAYLQTAAHPLIKEVDLTSMKWWIYGAAPLTTHEVKAIQTAFRTNNLVCVYGLTEAGPSGTVLLAHEHEAKAALVRGLLSKQKSGL